MPFYPFAVEQFLSEFELTADYNYTESGVHPLEFGELLELAEADLAPLLKTPLNYPQVNGELKLRELIAGLYQGAEADNVLVTVGASEANLLIATTLLEPGDEVVVMRPTYMQFAGDAQNFKGVKVQTIDLIEEHDWTFDSDALDRVISERTRIIAVVNPHNPTGHIFSEAEMQAVIAAAERVGAWLLADEVYRGAEREREAETPSFYGRYDKVLAINSMSKAYGLPGLRCGWVVGPTAIVQSLWRRHEYVAISASMLANKLAALALAPETRLKIIARTRALINRGFGVLQDYLAVHQGVFSVVPPQASAMCFVRYDLPIGSSKFAQRLRQEKNVLMLPGDCFGLDRHLRIASALPEAYLQAGFQRMNELVADIIAEKS